MPGFNPSPNMWRAGGTEPDYSSKVLIGDIKTPSGDSIIDDTTNSLQTSEVGANTIGDGSDTLSSAGSRQQLPSQACKRVRITAHEDNGNAVVVIGGSTVVAASGTRRGSPLYATQAEWFYVGNLNKLYWDATATGSKITYHWEG